MVKRNKLDRRGSDDVSADLASALERACAMHLLDPNVTLVDVGHKILDRQDQRVLTEKTVVRVHVRRKIRGREFERFKQRYPERVPNVEWIGCPIDVPAGPYCLHQWPWYYYWYPPNPRARRHEPLRGGISISNAAQYTYGTLGGKVIDRDSGAEMLLSNWHVLAGSWTAPAGLDIYQPGQMDGGRSQHKCARLVRDAFESNIDAAVAEVTGGRDCINEQLEIGRVTGVQAPNLGMRVIKSGRRSGITRGIISGHSGTMNFRYDGLRRTVRHVVHIASQQGAEVSAPGDSGSWWLEESTRKVVALHFAGSNIPEYALAISMPEVLDALQVDIAL